MISLILNEGENAIYFWKVDTLTGNNYVYDLYTASYALPSSFTGPLASGTSNTDPGPGTPMQYILTIPDIFLQP